MLKKIRTYIFIFIICLFSILCITAFGVNTETLKPEEAINMTYKSLGAKFQEININSHVIFEDVFLDPDKSSEIYKDIAQKLNITDLDFEKREEEGFNQIIARGKILEDQNITILVQSSRFDDFRESSIVIDLILTKEEYQLTKICDNIRNVLRNYGEGRHNITLTGYYEGKVAREELESKIKKSFNSIEAREIEGINSDNLISITGYTSNVKEKISYSGKKANINIAARYNSYEDKTQIWIGTPLIAIGY